MRTADKRAAARALTRLRDLREAVYGVVVVAIRDQPAPEQALSRLEEHWKNAVASAHLTFSEGCAELQLDIVSSGLEYPRHLLARLRSTSCRRCRSSARASAQARGAPGSSSTVREAGSAAGAIWRPAATRPRAGVTTSEHARGRDGPRRPRVAFLVPRRPDAQRRRVSAARDPLSVRKLEAVCGASFRAASLPEPRAELASYVNERHKPLIWVMRSPGREGKLSARPEEVHEDLPHRPRGRWIGSRPGGGPLTAGRACRRLLLTF